MYDNGTRVIRFEGDTKRLDSTKELIKYLPLIPSLVTRKIKIQLPYTMNVHCLRLEVCGCRNPCGGGDSDTTIMIIVIVLLLLVIFIAILLLYFYRKRIRRLLFKGDDKGGQPEPPDVSYYEDANNKSSKPSEYLLNPTAGNNYFI